MHRNSTMVLAMAQSLVNETVGVPLLLFGEAVGVCIGQLPCGSIGFQCSLLRDGLPIVLPNPAWRSVGRDNDEWNVAVGSFSYPGEEVEQCAPTGDTNHDG